MKKLKIALLLLVSLPEMTAAQDYCANSKHPGSLNLLRVAFLLNGKVKDLDTNFNIKIYCNDSLIHVAQSFSMRVESSRYDGQYERLSSLIKIPVFRLGPGSNLSAEIEIGDEKIRWNANEWKQNDSLLFCDSHGLFIYKYTKMRKFPRLGDRSRKWNFKKEIKTPAKENFPFVLIGWKLEEIELELEVLK